MLCMDMSKLKPRRSNFFFTSFMQTKHNYFFVLSKKNIQKTNINTEANQLLD